MPDTPSDPERALERRIEACADLPALRALRPAIAEVRARLPDGDGGAAVAGRFRAARLALLLEAPDEALIEYARACRTAGDPVAILDARSALCSLSRFRNELPGVVECVRFVDLFLHVHGTAPVLDPLARPGPARTGSPLRAPVVIVAGGTGPEAERHVPGYRRLVLEGLGDFSGTVISGGTRAGVSRIVGDLQDRRGAAITAIGYLPAWYSGAVEIDARYRETRRTTGRTFSALEPLQYWEDLVASGIAPAEVRLVGIGGGAVSAAEYRIALALGARVGVVPASGGAAAAILGDPSWQDLPNLIPLPADPATLRAFVAPDRSALGEETRDRLARRIHEEYQRMRLSQGADAQADPSLGAWEALPETLRRSNYSQADAVVRSLGALGYSIVGRPDGPVAPVTLPGPVVERLAEMEHGRWNAERLLDGWRWGPVRDVERKLSPHIVPWSRLPEAIREYDRNAVRQFPVLLAAIGCLPIPPAPLGPGEDGHRA